MPDLPKANYNVWVRGYGLVDSAKVKSAPGKQPEPDGRRSRRRRTRPAQYYPAGYWFSLMQVPDKSEFPGTGAGTASRRRSKSAGGLAAQR